MHCSETDRFNVMLSDKTTFRFPDDPIIDPRIIRAKFMFRDLSSDVSLSARVVGKARRPIKHLFNRKGS